MKRLITLTALFISLICHSQTDEIDRLTIELAYQKQDTTKVKTSLKLIQSLYETQNFKKAILYLDQTEQLATELNYTKGLAETNYYRALIYSKEDDYVNALDNFTKAKNLFQQQGDELGVARVNNNLGLIEIKRGNYENGMKNSLLAIKVFEELNLQEELSQAYINLAEVYYKTQQYEKALEYNFKALTALENINDLEDIKETTKNIGILYSIQEEHSKAIEYFERVLELLDEDDTELRVEILPRIGDEYLQLNEFDTAGQYLVQGLRISRNNRNEEGIIRALNSMGNLNNQLGEIRLANSQLNEAYELAKDSPYKTELLKNYRLHKELDSSRGYFQNAFFWQRKYYTLKDEIESENALVSFNTDNLELENLSTEKVPVPADNTNDSSNRVGVPAIFKTLTYGLGAGLAISLLFIGIMFYRKNSEISGSSKLQKRNKELREQNDAYYEQMQNLEETNKVKDRLFSIVSHDLKDSISSIKGFIDLLREDSLSKEEFYNLIPELSENANNASLLLFNLLNWSKSQMQSLKSNPELFNIQEVFRNKLRLIEQKAEEKRIVIIDESQRDFVYADRSMIEIVIQNLITNAVKFSRVNDIITVSNRDRNGKALIIIEDTGIGISEENLSKLFKPNNFTTIGTKNEKGTGLGLVICKELVELNNGRIWVESNQNVGTKFFVELPKSKPAE